MERERECASHLILSKSCPPLVFNHYIDTWPARYWSLDTMSQRLGNITVTCKICPRSIENLWESECEHLDITLENFSQWIYDEARENNPLKKFDKELYSCYIDYKYMKELFIKHPEMLQDVKWETFGLTDRDGGTSTIWIGSDGSYTNCHYDTYGFNLVAQIYGRKRWVLFPPLDKDCLYPTRIPYEESSIFSDVNITNPDFLKHPAFKRSRPYIVELEPGQVLYVPRHWWHYVECLEPSISINTWVELEEDHESRLHEAVVQFLFMNLYKLKEDINATDLVVTDQKLTSPLNWLNPNEDITDSGFNFIQLNNILNYYLTSGDEKKLNNLRKFAVHFKGVNVHEFSMEQGVKRKNVVPNHDTDVKVKRRKNSEKGTMKALTFKSTEDMSGTFPRTLAERFSDKIQMLESPDQTDNIFTSTQILALSSTDVENLLNIHRKYSGKPETSKCLQQISVFDTKSISEIRQNSDICSDKKSVSSEYSSSSLKNLEQKNITLENFAKCVLHPDVIDLISRKLVDMKHTQCKSNT